MTGLNALSMGLGMYPDETCFDVNRPSMLPYFFDDLTESQCKINLLTSGNTTGNTAQPGQPGVDPQTVANAQAACASQGGSWDSTHQVCTPDFLHQYGLWLLGGVGVLALLLFGVGSARGGR